ncbi:MAG: hypothetical protein AAFV53_36115 [Myxococcota bacterium]
MNTLEHISAVSSIVHEGLEAWARSLLRDAGIETTEVYGSFPPEGTIASHLVLFPYRIGPAESQVSQPDRSETLVGPRAKNLSRKSSGVPPMWIDIGSCINKLHYEHFPRAGRHGRQAEMPHPAPLIEQLPDPMKAWYTKQKDSGEEMSWVTMRGDAAHARLAALSWTSSVVIRMNYLVVIGEGARGTADRATSTAPVAVQTLSVLTAGLQMRRRVVVRVPPQPFDRKIVPYCKAMAKTLGGDDAEMLQQAVKDLSRKIDVEVTLLPGANLTNADFTGLMQAMQRPLQPTLHLGVQMALGGGAIFEPGVTAEVRPDRFQR